LNPRVTDYRKYLSNETRKALDWPIHLEGFRAPELLELGKLQGWAFPLIARLLSVAAPSV